MLELDIQRFGGRGASSSTGKSGSKSNTYEKLSMQLAREIYGKGISDEVAKRYAKDIVELPEGAVLSDYADWEIDKENFRYTKEGLQNRITYLTKGYEEARKEREKFYKASRKKK